MGVSIGDYNRDGNLDVAEDELRRRYRFALYESGRRLRSKIALIPSGLGVNTRLLGWGVGFFDMDNDGWLDILMSNGHVYPEVDKSNADLKYAEHKYLYRNLQNGTLRRSDGKGRPGHSGERSRARLRFRRLRQRRRYRYRGELRQRAFRNCCAAIPR